MSERVHMLAQAATQHKRIADFIALREFFAECRVLSKLQGIGEENSDLKKLQDNLRVWGKLKVLEEEKYSREKKKILSDSNLRDNVMPLHKF